MTNSITQQNESKLKSNAYDFNGDDKVQDKYEERTYIIDGIQIHVTGEYVQTGENVFRNLLNIFEEKREALRNATNDITNTS